MGRIVHRYPLDYDPVGARIDEEIEQRAFPDEQGANPVSAATRLAWHLQDELYRIDAAEAVLARGYVATTDYLVVAALAGRSPDEARAATQQRYEAALALAAATSRIAA